MKKPFTNRNLGFTLIELLVVTTIISILAGVIVSVMNPETQRRRAQDGPLLATFDKITSAVEAYFALYGVVPDTPDTCVSTITCPLLQELANSVFQSASGSAPTRDLLLVANSISTGDANNTFLYRNWDNGCVAVQTNSTTGSANPQFFTWEQGGVKRLCTSADAATACANYNTCPNIN